MQGGGACPSRAYHEGGYSYAQGFRGRGDEPSLPAGRPDSRIGFQGLDRSCPCRGAAVHNVRVYHQPEIGKSGQGCLLHGIQPLPAQIALKAGKDVGAQERLELVQLVPGFYLPGRAHLLFQLPYEPEEESELRIDAEGVLQKIRRPAGRSEEKGGDGPGDADETAEGGTHPFGPVVLHKHLQILEEYLLRLLLRLVHPGFMNQKFHVLAEYPEQMKGPDESLVIAAVYIEGELAGIAEDVGQADRVGFPQGALLADESLKQLERPFFGVGQIGIQH
ncbi:hypothetical protein TRIP_E100124 [uncultured Spirochaetota bacterium]|nr:hypothetical protein TRIP_E100124 [uncultured Spirochaetota bacterium]